MISVSNSDYAIRNYRPADFDSYVLLRQEAERLEPAGQPASPQAIAEHFEHPNYNPEQDLFVIESEKKIIGYTDMLPERAIGRAILSCWIHPRHRRKGLAGRLLEHAAERAKELGAKLLHVNIPQDNETAKSALPKLGFENVRRYLDLRLEMDRIRWQDINTDALGCRNLLPGEEDKLVVIQNRAFADHWGYNPNTVEEIKYDANRIDHSPEDIIVTCDGDKFIGYCWTEVTAGSGGEGQIYMIGTDPEYRGTGAGKRVLLAGLAHLKKKGMRVTTLTVDSENEVACALYESIGFEVRTTTLWYEKVVD